MAYLNFKNGRKIGFHPCRGCKIEEFLHFEIYMLNDLLSGQSPHGQLCRHYYTPKKDSLRGLYTSVLGPRQLILLIIALGQEP